MQVGVLKSIFWSPASFGDFDELLKGFMSLEYPFGWFWGFFQSSGGFKDSSSAALQARLFLVIKASGRRP